MFALAAPFAVMTLIAAQQAAPVPTAAPLQTPAPAAAPGASTATPAPNAAPEQVCRTQRISGSRRSERVCHTRAEWNLIRENARTNRDTASRNQRD